MKLKSVLLAVMLSSAFGSANALIVTAGSVPQIDSLVVRNPCGPEVGSPIGSPVLGCLLGNLGQLVSLSSEESLYISGGAAIVDSIDGTFSQLTISLVGNSLGTVILNIDATVNGFVTFSDGSGPDGTFALSGNGDNFFTATNVSGGFLSFTTFTSPMTAADIVANVTQIRLGAVGAVGAIPEPGTYALVLAGLGALGFIARRRKAVR